MPALSNVSLFKRLRSAVPEGTVFHTPENVIHPAEFTVPGMGNVRAYLFTVTRDQSSQGRPPGEFKIQLIIEGQVRSARGSLALRIAKGTGVEFISYWPSRKINSTPVLSLFGA